MMLSVLNGYPMAALLNQGGVPCAIAAMLVARQRLPHVLPIRCTAAHSLPRRSLKGPDYVSEHVQEGQAPPCRTC